MRQHDACSHPPKHNSLFVLCTINYSYYTHIMCNIRCFCAGPRCNRHAASEAAQKNFYLSDDFTRVVNELYPFQHIWKPSGINLTWVFLRRRTQSLQVCTHTATRTCAPTATPPVGRKAGSASAAETRKTGGRRRDNPHVGGLLQASGRAAEPLDQPRASIPGAGGGQAGGHVGALGAGRHPGPVHCRRGVVRAGQGERGGSATAAAAPAWRRAAPYGRCAPAYTSIHNDVRPHTQRRCARPLTPLWCTAVCRIRMSRVTTTTPMNAAAGGPMHAAARAAGGRHSWLVRGILALYCSLNDSPSILTSHFCSAARMPHASRRSRALCIGSAGFRTQTTTSQKMEDTSATPLGGPWRSRGSRGGHGRSRHYYYYYTYNVLYVYYLYNTTRALCVEYSIL